MKNPWLVPISIGPFTDHRLFCFPYAGGSAHVFRTWGPLLPPAVDVIAIQSPGKGSRLIERPCQTVEEVVDGVVDAIEPYLDECPFSFFGHSNGALIAFELSHALRARGLPAPTHLNLSASPAPWTRKPERNCAHLDDAGFIEHLRELDGTPPGVLDNAELLEILLPGLRADFSLGETYRYAHPAKLDVPTTVFHGEEDAIEAGQIEAWQEAIAPRIRMEPIAGGHFFVHSHAERLTGLLSRQLQRDIARTMPSPA
ncbi:thioesterase II family protein [Marilutibacter spongiae]|uniref:Thioesterase n=1 Tax=Marilutibacter spongiae TaxID=2025720 RepID=A0A7W3TPG0_9GAMM|nr:alpha/beta fold hydrolase [Lysobacter spongiae]MBB1062077.1 thioesterase [Lysobacter spongiae]